MKITKFLIIIFAIGALAFSVQSCSAEEMPELPETQKTGGHGDGTVKS